MLIRFEEELICLYYKSSITKKSCRTDQVTLVSRNQGQTELFIYFFLLTKLSKK